MDYKIFDKLLDAVCVVNADKELVACNEAFANIIGVSLKRLKAGKKVHEFIHFNDATVFTEEDGDWGRNEATLYKEFGFETSKGNKGQASVCVTPIEESSEKHWAVFLRDMTLEIQLQKKYRAELGEKEDVIEDLRKAKKVLEDYSENLEKMVQQRTSELQKSNQFINTMINSLGQGLLVFNKENDCLPIYTKACDDIFGMSPKNKKIWEVMQVVDESEISSFKRWTESLFDGVMDFEDLAAIGPQELTNNQDRMIGIEYYPFRDGDDKLEGVVTVATDKTVEFQALEEAKRNSELASMILKLVKNKNQFLSFIRDATKLIASLKELSSLGTPSKEELKEITLYLHSLKGGAGVYSIHTLKEMTHDLETFLGEIVDQGILEERFSEVHVKVNELEEEFEKFLEEYKELIGEGIQDGKRRVEVPLESLKDFEKTISDKNIRKVFSHNFIKQKAKTLFSSYDQLIESLSQDEQKKMKAIKFWGDGVKLDPLYFSELTNTLVHVFTNTVVHGLERPEERLENGKSEEGQVEVAFQKFEKNSRSWIRFLIQDDGRGLNLEKIKEKCLEKGILNKNSHISENELAEMIFAESFSTADSLSDNAGRGVGMSAVKQMVEQMGGKLHVDSLSNLGVRLVIDIPEAVA